MEKINLIGKMFTTVMKVCSSKKLSPYTIPDEFSAAIAAGSTLALS
jgi:hypothetical protein